MTSNQLHHGLLQSVLYIDQVGRNSVGRCRELKAAQGPLHLGHGYLPPARTHSCHTQPQPPETIPGSSPLSSPSSFTPEPVLSQSTSRRQRCMVRESCTSWLWRPTALWSSSSSWLSLVMSTSEGSLMSSLQEGSTTGLIWEM